MFHALQHFSKIGIVKWWRAPRLSMASLWQTVRYNWIYHLRCQRWVSPGIRVYQPTPSFVNIGSCGLGLALESIKATEINTWVLEGSHACAVSHCIAKGPRWSRQDCGQETGIRQTVHFSNMQPQNSSPLGAPKTSASMTGLSGHEEAKANFYISIFILFPT